MTKLKNIALPLIASATIALCHNAGAQISTAPGALSTNANIQSFITTAEGYFTTFNLSLTNTFSTNQPYQAWLGASYQSGVYLGGTVGIEAQPLSSFPGITLRDVITLAPQVGTLADEEFDLGYSITHVDTRITAFAGIDDDINNSKIGAAVGLEVEKALTQNTFAGMYIEGKTSDGGETLKKGQLVIGLMAGATF